MQTAHKQKGAGKDASRAACYITNTMSKQTAIKLKVEIGADHMVRLPDDVPMGPAEVIVLVDETATNGTGGEKSLLGLFADEPEIVDEAMAHVVLRRKNRRTRSVT